MSVVIDASALVVLALDRDRAAAVEQHLRRWRRDGEEVHAPMLARYEIASALTRAVAAGQLASNQVVVAWQQITSVPLVWHELSDGPAVVAMGAARPMTPLISCSPSSCAASCGRWTVRWRVTPAPAGCRSS